MHVDAQTIISWQENDPPFLKSWEIRLPTPTDRGHLLNAGPDYQMGKGTLKKGHMLFHYNLILVPCTLSGLPITMAQECIYCEE